MLANVGEVFPTNSPEVGTHEVIGSLLVLAAAFVVVMSFRERRVSRQSAFSVALILFTILFDPSVASNRLAFGVVPSLAPRYTMANLLLLLAIAIYVLGRVPAGAGLRGPARSALAVIGVLAAVIAIQLAVSTDNGLNRAETSKESTILGDRLIVNWNHIPHGQALCYAFAVETYAGESGDSEALVEAQADHLSELSPGPDQIYKVEGLPKLSECRSQ